MKARIITSFLVLIAATTASPQGARQRSAAHPAQLPADWKIEITTSGGFTGSGNGGMVLSADGALTITLGNTPASKRCTFQLNADELRALDAAVRNARPQSWTECYSLANLNTHCCDLIRTSFSLSARAGRDIYTTSWLTGSEGFPQDLKALIDQLFGPASLDARYRPLCVTP
jgi:hypothetical protein